MTVKVNNYNAKCGRCGKSACDNCHRYPCIRPSVVCFCDKCCEEMDDEE